MDISYKIQPEIKDVLTGAVLEYQVLSRLLEERKQKVGQLCQDAMKQLGVDPNKYLMDINPQQGVWDLRMINEPTPAIKPIDALPEVKAAEPSGNGAHEEIKEKVAVG